MKSRSKKMIYIALFSILTGIGVVLLSWSLLENLFGKYLCSTLKSKDIIECNIGELNLNPFSSFEIKSFRLVSSDQKIFDLEEVNISYNLSQIFSRKINFDTVLVHFNTLDLNVLPYLLPKSNSEPEKISPPRSGQDSLFRFIDILPPWDILLPNIELRLDRLVLNPSEHKLSQVNGLSLKLSILYMNSKKIQGNLSLSLEELILPNQMILHNLSTNLSLSTAFTPNQIKITNTHLSLQNLYKINIEELTLNESTHRICLDTKLQQEVNFDPLKSIPALNAQKFQLSGSLKADATIKESCMDKNLTTNFDYHNIELNLFSENIQLGFPEFNLPQQALSIASKIKGTRNSMELSLDHKLAWNNYISHTLSIEGETPVNFQLKQDLEVIQLDRFFQAFRYQLTQIMPLNLIPKSTHGKIKIQSKINLPKNLLLLTKKEPLGEEYWKTLTSKHHLSLFLDSISIAKNQTKLNTLSILGEISLTKNLLKVCLNTQVDHPSFKLNAKDTQASTMEKFTNRILFELKDPYDINENFIDIATNLESQTNLLNLQNPNLIKTIIPMIKSSLKLKKKRDRDILELSSFDIKIPNLGLETLVKGNARFSSHYNFENLKSEFNLKVNSQTLEKFQNALKTSGILDLQGSLDWSKEHAFKTSGKLNLDDFSLKFEGNENLQFNLTSANGNFHWKLEDQSQAPSSQTKQKDQSEKSLSQLISNYLSKQKDLQASYVPTRIKFDWQTYREKNITYKPIHIKQIRINEFSFENTVIDANFKDGLLNLYEFSTNFLNGTISTSNFLYFTDRPVSLVTEIHWTNINTSKLLDNLPKIKRKAKRFLLDSDPLLSGNINIDYNFINQNIQGAIEITKLGKEQLRMLLYFIDPYEKDKSIRHIKNALYFGSIRKVSAPIINGLFNLNVDLELLSIPVPTPKIQNFPISNLLSNFELAPNNTEGKSESQELTIHEGEI